MVRAVLHEQDLEKGLSPKTRLTVGPSPPSLPCLLLSCQRCVLWVEVVSVRFGSSLPDCPSGRVLKGGPLSSPSLPHCAPFTPSSIPVILTCSVNCSSEVEAKGSNFTTKIVFSHLLTPFSLPQLFEGLKAFRGVDNKIRLFRPELNMKRMCRSALRATLPVCTLVFTSIS